MSFKPLDRNVVRTKELLLDGEAMDQYHDPMLLAARHMWNDISAYDSGLGQTSVNEGLRVQIPNL